MQYDSENGLPALNGDSLLKTMEALANPYRLKIIAALTKRRVHVSQLAREIQISRPLLYMHLKRLERAGLVQGKLELAEDGKMMNYYELVSFQLQLTAQTIAVAVQTLSGKKSEMVSTEEEEKE